MPKSKTPKYTGDLDATQIADGMNAARRNARRLADDAKLLLDAERFPTAAALAVLSIEETGKIGILRHLAFLPEMVDRRKIWKDYRSHRSKNVAWIRPSLFANGARDLDSFRLATDSSAKHTALLDQYKQLSLYTDCLGSGNWSEPEEVVDVQVASSLVGIADLQAQGSTITVKEIELWKEHLIPVYGASLEVMKTALLNWFAAMIENGLLEGDYDSLEAFVRGG